MPAPNAVGTPTDLPILGSTQTWSDQPPPAISAPPAARAWDVSRGAALREPGPGEMPNIAPPPSTDPAQGYRQPNRGGLVNIDVSAGRRDPAANDVRGEYRTATRQNYAAPGSARGRTDWQAGYAEPNLPATYQRPAADAGPGGRYAAPPSDYRAAAPASSYAPSSYPSTPYPSTSYPSTPYPSTDAPLSKPGGPQPQRESYAPASRFGHGAVRRVHREAKYQDVPSMNTLDRAFAKAYGRPQESQRKANDNEPVATRPQAPTETPIERESKPTARRRFAGKPCDADRPPRRNVAIGTGMPARTEESRTGSNEDAPPDFDAATWCVGRLHGRSFLWQRVGGVASGRSRFGTRRGSGDSRCPTRPGSHAASRRTPFAGQAGAAAGSHDRRGPCTDIGPPGWRPRRIPPHVGGRQLRVAPRRPETRRGRRRTAGTTPDEPCYAFHSRAEGRGLAGLPARRWMHHFAAGRRTASRGAGSQSGSGRCRRPPSSHGPAPGADCLR